MGTNNALEIIKKRIKEDPELEKAYLEETRNYHIACKIREYRKRAKLTQKELAQLIDTKQSVISRLENAEYKGHSLVILEKISKVLNEPIESFLYSKKENSRILTLHIPPIMSEAASFIWNSNQIIIRSKSYSNVG